MGNIESLFYQGDYAQVLKKTYEFQKKINISLIPYILGSLSFLGRTEECEALYKSYQSQLSSVQKSYGHFFLALAWTRRSQYKKAKDYLQRNKILATTEEFKNSEINFFMTQGLSFFFYYLGDFDRSRRWSQKSLQASMSIDNFWMKALALDLLGNTLIQHGNIFEGLQHLQQAIEFSKIIGNNALIEAIETSELIYRNKFGIDIEDSFNKITVKFKKLATQDNFTKANLGLEIARQSTLRGNFRDAAATLGSISSLIYQAQNRRQEVRFNLRWAELCFLRNELTNALHFIRSGKKSLNFVDQTYEIQILGLEIKIYEALNESKLAEQQKARLIELSGKFKSIKNENILARDPSFSLPVPQASDDEINRLMQSAGQSAEQARKIILQTGFFSWLYRFMPLIKGVKYMLLNFENKSITCIDGTFISHKPNELSSLNYKIITTLSSGFKSKKQLLESIWGYTYDPLRHDSLIYSAFSNLRKILAEHSYFLETTEVGYHLHAEVLDYEVKSKVSKNQSVNFTIPMNSESLQPLLKLGLNSRQIQIMQYLDKNQFIAVKKVQELFAVSEITANRDLRSLNEMKLVVRVGQGRATHYTLK